MSTTPENPVFSDASTDRSREASARVAMESWENEGGHFPVLASASIVSGHASAVVRDQVTESGDLAAMRARFRADFAEARRAPAAAKAGAAE